MGNKFMIKKSDNIALEPSSSESFNTKTESQC
uniref:Uncharacterized protein n=1 Tax=Rhizophora mucronata TaxID=61149 RepID=A0A2P2R221_RHIMU